MIDQFFTISDVAQILQVSEKTIARMLQDDAIPGFKVANQWRFHPGDFNDWLDAKRRERSGAARSDIAVMLSGELDTVPLSGLAAEDLIGISPRAGRYLHSVPLFLMFWTGEGRRDDVGIIGFFQEDRRTISSGCSVLRSRSRSSGSQSTWWSMTSAAYWPIRYFG